MRIILFMLILLMTTSVASAQTVLFIPVDNRPVCYRDVVETAHAAGVNILTPPEELLGNRTFRGDPEGLMTWLHAHCGEADSIVVSAESLLYGSLVASRTHLMPEALVNERLAAIAALRDTYPDLRIYISNTITRTPRFSAGGVEPPYYETYGPKIFRMTELDDKAETPGLTSSEKAELKDLLATIPADALADWKTRRKINYNANSQLIEFARQGLIDYLLIGRDDCSPLSASHMESRHLILQAEGLSPSRYLSFPGADQLNMVLLARAINDYTHQMPVVRVIYPAGVGPDTIPTYEDKPVGPTVVNHIIAAGGIVLESAPADLILAVNTPEKGITLEGNNPRNRPSPSKVHKDFITEIKAHLDQGASVSVGDVAYGNGADNALMTGLSDNKLLYRLSSYSGWNTSSNSLGFAIAQGMLSSRMSREDKNRLLTVRFLDDWMYQSNVRGKVAAEVLPRSGGTYTALNSATPLLVKETHDRIARFASRYPDQFGNLDFRASFPWNRMFEVRIDTPGEQQ